MPVYLIIIISILSLLVLALLIYLIYMKHVFNKNFTRDIEIPLNEVDLTKTHYAPYIDKIDKNIKKALALPFEELNVTSFDNLKLYGRYYNNNSKKTVIFVHGFKALPYNNFATQLLSFLDHGYNALVIWQRSHGKSEGKYITFGNYESNDVDLWIEKVNEKYNPESIILYGTSMGGATVLIAEGEKNHKNVKVVIDDCGFKSIKTVLSPKLKARHIPPRIVLPIFNFYCKIFAKYTLFKKEPIMYVSKIEKPVVFIHSEKDDTVYISDSVDLEKKCQKETLKLFVKNAGHTSTFLANEEEIAPKLFDFLDKYTK